jgi:hypothetical protein
MNFLFRSFFRVKALLLTIYWKFGVYSGLSGKSVKYFELTETFYVMNETHRDPLFCVSHDYVMIGQLLDLSRGLS